MISASLSILLQYLRIFVPSQLSNRFLYYGTHYLIWSGTVFTILVTFIGVFICNPIRKAWNPYVAGRCLNSNRVLLSVSCLRILYEFQILLLPLPTIWSLQMGLRRKLGIVLIFGGGLLCVDIIILRKRLDN